MERLDGNHCCIRIVFGSHNAMPIQIQWNLSIMATIGEQHGGDLNFVEAFCVLNVKMSILNTYGA